MCAFEFKQKQQKLHNMSMSISIIRYKVKKKIAVLIITIWGSKLPWIKPSLLDDYRLWQLSQVIDKHVVNVHID